MTDNKFLKQIIKEKVEEVLDETAPPGMEDLVLKLKKQYGEDSPVPFKIAWSQYNKKKNAKNESVYVPRPRVKQELDGVIPGNLKIEILNALEADHKLKQEMISNMNSDETSPSDLKIYKMALLTIEKTIKEKEEMLKVLANKGSSLS